MQTAMAIYSNMIQVQGYCHWAVIIYDGSKDFEIDICNKIKANSANKVIVCKRSIYALSDGGNATIAATSTPVKIGKIPDLMDAIKRSKIDDNGDHTVDMLDPSIDRASFFVIN